MHSLLKPATNEDVRDGCSM